MTKGLLGLSFEWPKYFENPIRVQLSNLISELVNEQTSGVNYKC